MLCGGQRRLAAVRAGAGDSDATTWQVRLRLRRKAVAASRGSRKQGSSGGGRCGSKDGRGGWAALEGVATAALDLQAGRVSKAKGAVKAAAGRGGRKRVAAVRRGLRGEGLVTAGCTLPRASRWQWQGGTGGRQHRGVRQRSARLGAMGGSKDGDDLRGEDSSEAGDWQRQGSRVRRGLRQRAGRKVATGGRGEDSDDRREEAAGASTFGAVAAAGVGNSSREERKVAMKYSWKR
ncbi:hypothetical protein BHE74_00051882 [Ensete ventricosum]|nr:hypothetical protein BHE74_00051882 [Ensete ventricosum]